MPRRRIRFPFCAGLTAFSLLLPACAPLDVHKDPGPAGPPPFALMGDTPYSDAEARSVGLLIEDLNREPMAFVAHIGDITSGRGPCTDEWFGARKSQFQQLRHPLVLLPGDNDWTDCHRSGFDPLERLAKWRSLFCFVNTPALRVETQPGPYCEHVRWSYDGLLFVGLNVQGSNDNLGRNAAMDAEHAARARAALEWLDEAERAFKARGLRGLVILMQANPFLKPRSGRNAYERLLERLQALAAAYPGRVTLVHGDTHRFRDDEPLPGLRRVEVYGSPFVAWLRARPAGGQLRVEVGGKY